MNTRQRFKELVRQCLDADDLGWHFWLSIGDKWITGEIEVESNGDEYIVVYLVDRVDYCGYPFGNILVDAYIDLKDVPEAVETRAGDVFDYLIEELR